MSLATTSIADRIAARNNASNNTVDINTMPNIKSIELIQNIGLGNKSITKEFVDTCLTKSKGKTITTTRGLGGIYENGRDLSLLTSFIPMPESLLTSSGRNNRVVVIHHFTDGSSKILNRVETVKFWDEVLGGDSENIDFKVTATLNSDYDKKTVIKGIINHRFQSIRVAMNDVNNLFSYTVKPDLNGKDWLVLRPNNADVNLHSQIVELDSQTIGFSLTEDFYVDETKVKPSFASCSKSAKRREGRKAKAQSNAGRKSVADLQAERQVESTPVVEPVVETPATPQVDLAAMIQQAVAAAVAPLTQEIASLREELKAKDAEIKALKAANAEPVAEAAPVVEEVTPEPVAEEPVEKAPALKSKAAFFAGLKKAKAVKSQAEQNLDDINVAVDEFSLFDEE